MTDGGEAGVTGKLYGLSSFVVEINVLASQVSLEYSGGGVLGILGIDIAGVFSSATCGRIGGTVTEALSLTLLTVLLVSEKPMVIDGARVLGFLSLFPVEETSKGFRCVSCCLCLSARSLLPTLPSIVKFSEPPLLRKESRREKDKFGVDD